MYRCSQLVEECVEPEQEPAVGIVCNKQLEENEDICYRHQGMKYCCASAKFHTLSYPLINISLILTLISSSCPSFSDELSQHPLNHCTFPTAAIWGLTTITECHNLYNMFEALLCYLIHYTT